ncbi:MAG: lasso peptide biosynthesis B2 protein [Acidobacteriota bacterium]
MGNRLKKLPLAAWAGMIRLGVAAFLKVFPYRVWSPLLLAATRSSNISGASDRAYVDRVVEAVGITERFLPVGRCVERSLTAWLLLRKRAACRVCMGVGLDPAAKVYAHAWLEVDDEIVLGAPVDEIHPLNIPG